MTPHKYHHGDLKNALVKAGVEILARDGIAGLSLRKVAQHAGVSHAAPYAHFTDKQALIAAISTEGLHLIYQQLHAAREEYPQHPLRQLVAAAWAYVRFARSAPAHFKVTFSAAVENEKEYPTLVEMTRQCFEEVLHIVEAGQAAGLLNPGPVNETAVGVWSAVHGFASLLIEGQISHTVLQQSGVFALLLFTLDQLTLIPLKLQDYSFLPEVQENG